MANSFTVTKNLVNDHWEILGSVGAGPLPPEVFIYSNTGTAELGTFLGVCSVAELQRLQIFNGVRIDIFGNKSVRHGTLKITVAIGVNPDTVITNIINSLKQLSIAYSSVLSSTQTVTI